MNYPEQPAVAVLEGVVGPMAAMAWWLRKRRSGEDERHLDGERHTVATTKT